MWLRRSHILVPLTKYASGPKVRKIIWNDVIEESFKKLNYMVSAETLLRYPDWTIPFTIHTDDSNKYLGVLF